MTVKREMFDALAALYAYPEKGYAKRVKEFRQLIGEDHPRCAKDLIPLTAATRGKSDGHVEELYTRTFDINAICCMEIGWHIYGEEYARGALLVRLREALREEGIPESSELPDHLTHVLQLVGRLDDDMAKDLAGRYLLPALDKMMEGMAGKDSPYECLVKTTSTIVRRAHPGVKVIQPQVRRPESPDSGNRLPIYSRQEPSGPGCGSGGCGPAEGNHGTQ